MKSNLQRVRYSTLIFPCFLGLEEDLDCLVNRIKDLTTSINVEIKCKQNVFKHFN